MLSVLHYTNDVVNFRGSYNIGSLNIIDLNEFLTQRLPTYSRVKLTILNKHWMMGNVLVGIQVTTKHLNLSRRILVISCG